MAPRNANGIFFKWRAHTNIHTLYMSIPCVRAYVYVRSTSNPLMEFIISIRLVIFDVYMISV